MQTGMLDFLVTESVSDVTGFWCLYMLQTRVMCDTNLRGLKYTDNYHITDFKMESHTIRPKQNRP